MDQRGILIIKLVPEAISEELATIVATTLLASLAAATFARQRRESDPDKRWDWPLIIDEIQKFINAEHPGDAEVFFTQTRSLGVGIHGAHQGLWQLGEAVQAAVIQSLGGLSILGPIKQDTRALVEAYRPSGVTEDDFAGLRAREHMLLRFPVGEWDSGLVSAFPRERPPATTPHPAERTRLEAAIRTAPFRNRRAAVRSVQDSDDDAWLEQVWACAERSGEDAAVELALTLLGDDRPPEDQEQRIAALAARATAHGQAQAQALAADPDQVPDPALRLRELSALRYGVDPILSAAAIRVFARRYPADAPHRRRPQGTSAQGDEATKGSATPGNTTSTGSGTITSSATVAADPVAEWLDLRRRIKLE